jgi:hypothetical protein
VQAVSDPSKRSEEDSLEHPDVSRAFREAAHQQSAAVAASEQEAEDQAFIDAISETPET